MRYEPSLRFWCRDALVHVVAYDGGFFCMFWHAAEFREGSCIDLATPPITCMRCMASWQGNPLKEA